MPEKGSRPPRRRGELVAAGAVGFLLGAGAVGVVLWWAGEGEEEQAVLAAAEELAARGEEAAEPPPEGPETTIAPPGAEAPPPAGELAETPAGELPDIARLRDRQLLLPVQGVALGELDDNFAEARRERRHDAIDILAPRNTPVQAVEGGTIARLFESDRGGLTVYQFDPTESYVYYYAHLESYAAGLEEGESVARGQVIGYVGTSGNAPPATPHLHFAIHKLGPEKRWWEGEPVNPFLVFQR
jgi:murein DD-endopeptidase MepM/ murein hydrolase activator NlpD